MECEAISSMRCSERVMDAGGSTCSTVSGAISGSSICHAACLICAHAEEKIYCCYLTNIHDRRTATEENDYFNKQRWTKVIFCPPLFVSSH